MGRPWDRLAVVGVLAALLSGCGGGAGSSAPYTGNQSATYQSGSNGQALLRFIQGSPDVSGATGSVDVCIDQTPLGFLGGSASYGKPATSTANSGTLVSIPAGIAHTLAVYTTLTGGGGNEPGAECATAPGPYFGLQALAVATIT